MKAGAFATTTRGYCARYSAERAVRDVESMIRIRRCARHPRDPVLLVSSLLFAAIGGSYSRVASSRAHARSFFLPPPPLLRAVIIAVLPHSLSSALFIVKIPQIRPRCTAAAFALFD